MEQQDYNKTLNLPKTDFPMRASLPEREPEALAQWQENHLYEKLMERNDVSPFTFCTMDLHMQMVLFIWVPL